MSDMRKKDAHKQFLRTSLIYQTNESPPQKKKNEIKNKMKNRFSFIVAKQILEKPKNKKKMYVSQSTQALLSYK